MSRYRRAKPRVTTPNFPASKRKVHHRQQRADVLSGDDPLRGPIQVFPQDRILRIDRRGLAAAAASLAAWAEAARAQMHSTSTRKGR